MFCLKECVLFSILSIAVAIKFSAESFSEIAILAKEGKQHLDSINEKSQIPQYGSCWKSAVSDLQIGCKFLSENVQSDIALRFTDCFLQMSGHDPIVCENPKICLQELPDRAFNAYTEFYTHTQSICYFLQSQIWHEEAERTIDKLSMTSKHVSVQLKEAEKTQELLLGQQRESLTLQHNLVDSGKNIALALESSRDKIATIMNDFHASTLEQKKALYDVFEKISSLKSWAVEEVSWLNSMFFYTSAVVLGYFFTSSARTQQARIFIFILLTINYFVERYIYSEILNKINDPYETLSESSEKINDFIWLCRKFFITICIIVTVVIAFKYCDYNILNYKLLLDIKNQNMTILNQFKSPFQDIRNNVKMTNINNASNVTLLDQYVSPKSPNVGKTINGTIDVIPLPYLPVDKNKINLNSVKNFLVPKFEGRDEHDMMSVISEKSQLSDLSPIAKTPYSLRRSSRTVKKRF